MPKIEVLVTEDELMARIDALADALAPRLPGDWTAVSILIGATPFTSDLMKALARRGVHPILDVIWLESYRDARESSGRVRGAGRSWPVRRGTRRAVAGRCLRYRPDARLRQDPSAVQGRPRSGHLRADAEALGPPEAKTASISAPSIPRAATWLVMAWMMRASIAACPISVRWTRSARTRRRHLR